MEGVEGRDGSRETDTPARDVSVGLCVCEGCKGVPWKTADTRDVMMIWCNIVYTHCISSIWWLVYNSK